MSGQYCTSCKTEVVPEVDVAEGHSFCPACGLQFEDLVFETGISFAKSGDSAHVVGSMIREDMMGRAGGALGGGYGDNSRERSVGKGREHIVRFADQLGVPGAQDYVDQAARLYQIAISSGFTRGRRTNQVSAACLYIVLRQDNQPYMLIDFCNLLRVNVYVLGSTFLRLAEKLRLNTHPVFCRPVDPSLYIHRFAGKLKIPANKVAQVANTATQLVAQMKRDWLQTGRRPAGVCGAALWLSAHIHGFELSRKDVIKVVSVGETTLQHRISELRGTAASEMTLAEFQAHSITCYKDTQDLIQQGPPRAITAAAVPAAIEAAAQTQPPEAEPAKAPEWSGAQCRCVVNGDQAAFAYGMCYHCYEVYVSSSGGIWGGSQDPPAYLRNLRKDVKAKQAAAIKKQNRIKDGEADDAEMNGIESEFALAIMDDPTTLKLAKALKPAEDLPMIKDIDACRAAVRAANDLHPAPVDNDNDASCSQAHAPNPPPRFDEASCSHGPRSALAPTPPVTDADSAEAPQLNDASQALQKLMEGPQLDIQIVRGSAGAQYPHATRDWASELSEQNAAPPPEDDLPDDEDGAAVVPEQICDTPNKRKRITDGEDDGEADAEQNEAEIQAAEQMAVEAVESVAPIDTFSDIDDDEIDGYMATPEEIELKSVIWSEMNKDWVEKQAAKAAALKDAAEAAKAAGVDGAPPAKKRKGRPGAKVQPKAVFSIGDTPAESVSRMIAAKNLTGKLNKNAMENFWKETEEIAKGHVPADAVKSTKLDGQLKVGVESVNRNFLGADSDFGDLLADVRPAAPARARPMRLGRL